MAAAVSTPSGAPPVPITACTPLPATAAAMPADRSPSPMRRMRAPVARISRDQLLVPRPIQHDDRELVNLAAERPCDGAQVLAHRRVEIHEMLRGGARRRASPCRGRARAAARRARRPPAPRWRWPRQWRTGWCLRADRRRCRPHRRIGPRAGLLGHADLLADEQHRRLVALALADDDGAVDGHGVHLVPHRLDGGLIRQVPVALPHRMGAGNRRLLHDAQELEREIRFHLVVLQNRVLHGGCPIRGRTRSAETAMVAESGQPANRPRASPRVSPSRCRGAAAADRDLEVVRAAEQRARSRLGGLCIGGDEPRRPRARQRRCGPARRSASSRSSCGRCW